MIYGQELDLEHEDKPADKEILNRIHRHKTGRMISLCGKLGSLDCNLTQQQTDALCRYQYVVLKNRNIGYGLHPASLDEHLIHHDWSDERILSAVDAYTAYYLQ